jgi:esterase/lipase
VRTHWNLRLLAKQIARNGAHVLRFDYHGIGDSSGRVEQVDCLDVWANNVNESIEHLKRESGAETVMLLGQRFGGLLAGQTALERTDVNSVVLWEPVLKGASYLQALRAMHSEMIDLWVCKIKTANDSNQEEILGSVYCRSLIEQIEAVELDLSEIIQPQLVIELTEEDRKISAEDPSMQKVIYDDRPGSWTDLHSLETAYLRPKTTQQIVKLVKDMFDRLEKFGALSAPSSSLAAEGCIQ